MFINNIFKVAAAIIFAVATFAYGVQEPEYVPGMVIVKFKDVLTNGGKWPLETQYNTINRLNEKYGVYKIEPGFKYLPDKPIDDPHGKWKWHHWLEVMEKLRYDTYYVLKYGNKEEPREVAEVYAKDPNVDMASPNFRFKRCRGARGDGYDFIPNDTGFPAQWNLFNYGQTGGTPGADIDAPTGWDYWPVPFWEPWVAVIDTGADLEHLDLRWNLVQGIDINTGSGYPWDDDGHGTHVSGIIAAHTNNNRGVAGIGRNDLIKVMPIKTELDDWSLGNGIQWGYIHGADVENFSWGSSGWGPENFPIVRKAIEGAYALGVAMCASKGNDGFECGLWTGYFHYPSDYAEVFGIGATDDNDAKAPFSNYGYGTLCVAPGVNILSTYIYTNEYEYMSGTSMSAPHAAAICALITASYDDIFDPPSARVEQIRYILVRSCDDLYYDGWDIWSGWGRVSLANVMQIITDSQEVGGSHVAANMTETGEGESSVGEVLSGEAPAVFAVHPAYPNPAKDYLYFPFDLPNPEADVTVAVYDLSGRRIATLSEAFSEGRNEIKWDCAGDGGRLPKGVYFYRVEAGDNAGTAKFVISD